jgi:cellulose synthase/poly-beta-1,6-N-acetylglucosamine synthase-like glycosyltransferase
VPGPSATKEEPAAGTERGLHGAPESNGAPAAPRLRPLDSLVGLLVRRLRDTRAAAAHVGESTTRPARNGDSPDRTAKAAPKPKARRRAKQAQRPKPDARKKRRRLHAVEDAPEKQPSRWELLSDLERRFASGRISRPEFERRQPIAARLTDFHNALTDAARSRTTSAGAVAAAAGSMAAKAATYVQTRAVSIARALRRLWPVAVTGVRGVQTGAVAIARAAPRLWPVVVTGVRRAQTGAVAIARAAGRLWPVLLAFLLFTGVVATVLIEIPSTTTALYTLFVGASLILGLIGWTTLAWMLDAWRNPEALAATRLPPDKLEPQLSFSLIVAARHEEAVLATTLSRLVTTDHPDFEVVVVVGDDDPGTAAVAERVAARHPELVKVVVDTNPTKNKPKALNTALPHCNGEVVGVFDAEDDVHPGLLKRVDQRFQRTAADVVQAGVQLMNFHSSWFAVRNVLEYYFWFRSRLHLHARQGFIPLGGNTVFLRAEVLRAVGGWDPDCLTEDCELGVRLSSLGARTVVVYEPELVTREESPATLAAFLRQRTRWNQGFLQTLAKGYWRRLPPAQTALGVYILGMPYLIAIAWLMMPAALLTAVFVTAPVPITLISILPALPLLSILAVEMVGLHDFCRMYGERATTRDYARLIVGLPFFQVVISFAAARAVVREALGLREWEKTMHFGFHLALQPSGPAKRITEWPRIPSRRSRLPQKRMSERQTAFETAQAGEAPLSESLAARIPLISIYADALDPEPPDVREGLEEARRKYRAARAAQAGRSVVGTVDRLVGNRNGHTLLTRLRAAAAVGGTGVMPALAPPRSAFHIVARRSLAAWLRGHLDRIAAARVDVGVVVSLLVVTGIVQATNMLHWPGTLVDEGTYTGEAWAVGTKGVLAPYTFSYGHPPLAWISIALWSSVTGLFSGHTMYSIDGGREFMFAVFLVSAGLVYVLARRMGIGRLFAAVAVVLFAFSPLSVYFHRAVFLDNPATMWVLAAFALAFSPQRRLWAYAGSGACFAASILSKETTLVLLPALVVAVVQNVDKRTARYCLTFFASSFLLLAASFPLYATLKGELIPGRGHVSLLGYAFVQLFSRKTSGSIFDMHSAAYGLFHFWMHLDPWLLGAALLLSPLAVIRRSTRAVALAFLIQVVLLLRPGYLPQMYVTAMLPFAALIVAGGADALVRFARSDLPEAHHPPAWRDRRETLGRVFARLEQLVAAVIVLGLGAIAAFIVAPQWAAKDRTAMTVKLDGPQRAAERWIVEHVGHHQRLIVTDGMYVYLVQHGFGTHPVKGGFFSRTVVSYWPLDYDPAVKRSFPNGWRDFDYVVSDWEIRVQEIHTPTTAKAIAHAHPVATFGRGFAGQIAILKIDAPRPLKTTKQTNADGRADTAKHPQRKRAQG